MNLIRENKYLIMKKWEEEVRDQIPAATEQNSRMALYDSLPDFLDNLAQMCDLNREKYDVLAHAKEDLIGKVHGQHRANTSYPIDQMIHEYYILQKVIVELYKEKGHLDLYTYELLNNSFQRAVQISASQFSKTLLDAQEGFVMSLVHDLRSPLTALTLQVDMLKRHAEDSSKNMAERMSKSCARLAKMIEDLLNTLSPQSQKSQIHLVECDLSDIIQTVISDFKDRAHAVVIFKGDRCLGDWNPMAFERVFDNLISNAFKYGDATQPIRVTLDQDAAMVHIKVHNYGVPIPKDELVSIFNKFKRSDRAQLQKGWGIGLSLVKSVVEAHRGTILVSSDDSGTTFKLELPRNKVDHIERGPSFTEAPLIKH